MGEEKEAGREEESELEAGAGMWCGPDFLLSAIQTLDASHSLLTEGGSSSEKKGWKTTAKDSRLLNLLEARRSSQAS